jgi:hypothetical protein
LLDALTGSCVLLLSVASGFRLASPAVAAVKFLHLVRPFMAVIPEVKTPERKVGSYFVAFCSALERESREERKTKRKKEKLGVGDVS